MLAMSNICDGYCQCPGQECVQPRGTEGLRSSRERKDTWWHGERQETDYKELQEIIEHLNMKHRGAVGQLGAKATIESGSNLSRKPWSWTTGSRRRKLIFSRKGKKGRIP